MAESVNKKAAERDKLIARNLQRLTAKQAKDRREAALWLGEAAVVEAVPDLVRVFQTDRNRGVRSAAAYALGQFRAVEVALEDGKQAEVEKLLHRVEAEGKYGSRGSPGRWLRLTLGLLLSFVAFAALAWIVYGGPEAIAAALRAVLPNAAAQAAATPDLPELAGYTAGLRSAFTPVSADVTTLQQQYTTALAGNPPDCAVVFHRTEPFALAEAGALRYPELGVLAARINEMQSSFSQSVAAFEAACQSGAPLTAASAGPMYALLRPAVDYAPQIEAALAALEARLTPTPTPSPTATPTPTETPVPPSATPRVTPIPTTDITLTDPRRHLAALYALVDSMIGVGGQANALRENWQTAFISVRPAACGARQPVLPDSYVLTEAEAAASPELAAAVDLINNGLELLQTSWTNLVLACNSDTTNAAALQGQRDAQAVITSFQNAQQLLDALAGS